MKPSGDDKSASCRGYGRRVMSARRHHRGVERIYLAALSTVTIPTSIAGCQCIKQPGGRGEWCQGGE
jgi:hypothetical protein